MDVNVHLKLNPAKADSTSESTLVGLSLLARSVYRRAMTDSKDALWRGAHRVCRGGIGVDGAEMRGNFDRESKSLLRLIRVPHGRERPRSKLNPAKADSFARADFSRVLPISTARSRPCDDGGRF